MSLNLQLTTPNEKAKVGKQVVYETNNPTNAIIFSNADLELYNIIKRRNS